MQVFAKHKHIYDLYYKCGEMVGLSPEVRNEIYNAWLEVEPGATVYMRCPACVAEWLVRVYKWYETQIK